MLENNRRFALGGRVEGEGRLRERKEKNKEKDRVFSRLLIAEGSETQQQRKDRKKTARRTSKTNRRGENLWVAGGALKSRDWNV